MKVIILIIFLILISLISAETTFFDNPHEFFIISSSPTGVITESTGGIARGTIRKIIDSGECLYEWNCTDWSKCFSGKQIRNCTNVGTCSDDSNPPETEKKCFYIFEGETIWREIINKNAIIFYFAGVSIILFIVFYLKRDYFRKLFK